MRSHSISQIKQTQVTCYIWKDYPTDSKLVEGMMHNSHNVWPHIVATHLSIQVFHLKSSQKEINGVIGAGKILFLPLQCLWYKSDLKI